MGAAELQANLVEEAIRGRRAIRRYRDTPVPRAVVERLLAIASRSPSGSNTQPWRVYVLTGHAKTQLGRRLVEAHHTCRDQHSEAYRYDTREPLEPYASRRADFGARLYGRLGIAFTDNPQRQAQIARNYEFFGARVGLMFTLDARLGQGAWIDLGMFMQTFMIAARSIGLDTCAQVSFAKYHRIIKPALGIPEGHIVVCGMALGHADTSAPENQGWMPREGVERFTTFIEG